MIKGTVSWVSFIFLLFVAVACGITYLPEKNRKEVTQQIQTATNNSAMLQKGVSVTESILERSLVTTKIVAQPPSKTEKVIEFILFIPKLILEYITLLFNMVKGFLFG